MLDIQNAAGKSVKDVAMYNKRIRELVEQCGGVNKAAPQQREGMRLDPDHRWHRRPAGREDAASGSNWWG